MPFLGGAMARIANREHRGEARKRARGFTLVELAVTLAVAGVLVAIAIPSFREVGINTGVSENTNDLVTALNTARAEAVKRGVRVAVIATGGWSGGWNVQADGDHDNAFGTPPTDPIIDTHGPFTNGYTITGVTGGGGSNTQVVFNSAGALQSPTTRFDFNVCRPDHVAAKSRWIRVGGSGAVTSSLDASGSPAPGC